jgi:hypothetical protein
VVKIKDFGLKRRNSKFNDGVHACDMSTISETQISTMPTENVNIGIYPKNCKDFLSLSPNTWIGTFHLIVN